MCVLTEVLVSTALCNNDHAKRRKKSIFKERGAGLGDDHANLQGGFSFWNPEDFKCKMVVLVNDHAKRPQMNNF